MKNEYIITAENRLSLCDEIADLVEKYCSKFYKNHKEVLRYRLSVEDCLLAWLTEDSIGETISISCEKKLISSTTIKIIYSGKQKNPLIEDEETDKFSFSALKILGLAPEYRYANSKNEISIYLQKKPKNPVLKIAIILFIAVALGKLGNLFMPQLLINDINNIVLSPINEMFTSILGFLAGPMIFLSVTWGIYGIGDTISFNKIGKSVIFTYLKDTVLFGLFGLLLIPFFNLKMSNEYVGVAQFSELVKLISGCIPESIVAPFANGTNMLQIIFVAVITGIALLYLGKKTTAIVTFIEEINILIKFIMNAVSKLVPYFMFVIMLKSIWEGTFDIVINAWKFFLIFFIGIVFTFVFFMATTSIKYKINPFVFLKKIGSSVVIALMTASSSATFENTVNICEEKLGINKSVVDFGIPLGMVMYKPFAAFYFMLILFFTAQLYGIECSIVWFVIAVICSVLLSIATPPIPGGGILVYTMLFLQFGIPMSALAIVSAIDLVTDFFITSIDIFSLFHGITNAANRAGMLDKEKLRK